MIKLRVRGAFRQTLGQHGARAFGRECRLMVETPRRVRIEKLDIERAERVGEPRPPGHAQAIAELHERPHLARPPSPHEAEVASVPRGEQLGYGIRLAERLGRDEDALVDEVHGFDDRSSCHTSYQRKPVSSFLFALRVLNSGLRRNDAPNGEYHTQKT